MSEATNYVSGEDFVQHGGTQGSPVDPLLKDKGQADV
jgi:hypothetical protein